MIPSSTNILYVNYALFGVVCGAHTGRIGQVALTIYAHDVAKLQWLHNYTYILLTYQGSGYLPYEQATRVVLWREYHDTPRLRHW